jgi:hypothetical protein
MPDARQAIVEWAQWAHANNAHFNYTEGPERMSAIGVWPPKFPIFADCSAFVTWCYWIAGAPDPNGLGYNHEGYTGTLLHGLEIPRDQVQPGDVVVYGPGTGAHTALIIQGGADPLTISHGQQGDPSLVHVSQDGRQPQRFLRFKTEGSAVRHPSELDKHTVKVATPDLHKVAHAVTAPAHAVAHLVTGPQPVQDLTHIQSAPQATESHPQAPQTAPTHEVVQPPTSAPQVTTGWPIIKEVETLINDIVKGPQS